MQARLKLLYMFNNRDINYNMNNDVQLINTCSNISNNMTLYVLSFTKHYAETLITLLIISYMYAI